MEQKKPANSSFDNISEEDLAKIQRLRGVTESSIKVDQEWLILTEFAKHFGWQAYKDARDDKVSSEEMMMLITAARKLDHLTLYNNARAAFIGAGAVKTKSPSNTFNKMTSKILKHVKADE